MPLRVTLLMAVTADGMIARRTDHFPDWTGSADKRFFAAESRSAGVVIMGSRTFATLPGPLPGRRHIVLTRSPQGKPAHPEVLYTDEPPHRICRSLCASGHTRAILAGGAAVNTLFARAGLIDEVVLTVTPRLFGTGLTVFNAPLDLTLSSPEAAFLDDECLCLRYRVVSDRPRMIDRPR